MGTNTFNKTKRFSYKNTPILTTDHIKWSMQPPSRVTNQKGRVNHLDSSHRDYYSFPKQQVPKKDSLPDPQRTTCQRWVHCAHVAPTRLDTFSSLVHVYAYRHCRFVCLLCRHERVKKDRIGTMAPNVHLIQSRVLLFSFLRSSILRHPHVG